MKIVNRVDFALHLKGCNRYQGRISFVCERNVYFYVVVFSKSMSCLSVQGTLCRNTFHVQSNLGLTHFEYFHEKTLHVEGHEIPKANLKCTCRLISSRTDRDLKQDDVFNTTWLSVLSIDKCYQVTSFSTERTDHHVLLKASCCLKSLILTVRRLSLARALTLCSACNKRSA